MSRRKRKGSQGDGGDGGGDWLTTYSDLVTLLLCFFVLLFSMAEVSEEDFSAVSASLQSAFSGGTGVLPDNRPGVPIDLLDDILEEDGDLAKLYSQLQDYAEEEGIEEEMTITLEERGIVVRFKDSVFFDSGSANIKADSHETLNATADILNQDDFSNRQVKIEGHTDSDPITRSNEFPTNWELSASRATNVLRYLVENKGMDGGRVSSSGYGQYRPITSNDTREQKAKNRRVDIVILTDSYEGSEPKTNME